MFLNFRPPYCNKLFLYPTQVTCLWFSADETQTRRCFVGWNYASWNTYDPRHLQGANMLPLCDGDKGQHVTPSAMGGGQQILLLETFYTYQN